VEPPKPFHNSAATESSRTFAADATCVIICPIISTLLNYASFADDKSDWIIITSVKFTKIGKIDCNRHAITVGSAVTVVVWVGPFWLLGIMPCKTKIAYYRWHKPVSLKPDRTTAQPNCHR